MRHTATRDIRLEELDLANAPRPDVELVPSEKKARYNKVCAALGAYWGGTRPKEIARLHGVSRQLLSYYEDRFFEPHPDGRIYGFRALVPGTRIAEFTRTKPSTSETINDGTGTAGSFKQCLSAYPPAKKVLDDEIAKKKGKTPASVAINITEVHERFRDALRAAGVGDDKYPLCTVKQAYESVRNYLYNGIRNSGSKDARTGLLGHEANDGLDGGSGKMTWLQSLLPCDVACYDEQQLPAIGTVAFEHEGQRFVIPMERISLCLLVSMRPKCALAYYLSMRSRVSSADFLETFNHLLTPWSPRTFTAVPTLAYKEGAGFPNGLVPGFLEGYRLGLIRIDNDLTHYADSVLVYLRELLGLTIEFGQIRRWITRAAVEQLFGRFQRELSKLPCTTGSGPADRHVDEAAGNAVKWEITIEQLAELLEVIIANFNGTPLTELYSATPIEYLKREWAGKVDGGAIPGYFPTVREELPLPLGICKVMVRGNQKKGVPPYIELDHAKYTSDVLRYAWNLIGTPMIALLQRDHRLIKLRYQDGTSLGAVNVTGHWSMSYHDRATRKEIIDLRKQRLIQYGASDDPIDAFKAFKFEQMGAHAAKNPGKVMRGTNKVLASIGTLTQSAQPEGQTKAAPALMQSKVPETSDTWTRTRLAAQENLK